MSIHLLLIFTYIQYNNNNSSKSKHFPPNLYMKLMKLTLEFKVFILLDNWGKMCKLFSLWFKQLRRDRQGRRRWVGRKRGRTRIKSYIRKLRYRIHSGTKNKSKKHNTWSYKVKKRSYKVKKRSYRKGKKLGVKNKKKKRYWKSSGRIAPN